MNIRFLHGTALIAGLGTAIALAGCGNGNNPGGGSSALGPAASTNSNEAIATVGTTTVTHGDLGALLEARYGPDTLPLLIDNQLIFEEGKSRGIEVSDADIEADLQRRAKDNPQLKDALEKGGPQVALLKNQVKREITVQRLLTSEVKLDDTKLKAFFSKYHTYYDEPARLKIGLLVSSTKTRADVMSRALKSKSKTFAQLVNEQKSNKNDPAGAISTAERPDYEMVDNFPPGISAQLAKLPKGGITAPTAQQVGLPTPVFMIFKVVDVKPLKKADLTALKPLVEMDYKLAQLAQTEVKKNPANPEFSITLQRTRAAIAQQSPGVAPTLRDVLTYILQFPFQNYIQSLRTKGTVQITDSNYKSIAPQYQPPITPGAPAGTPGAAGTPSSGSAPATEGTPATASTPAAASTPAP